MSGIRFVDPPASIYRRRPLIDLGLVVLLGAVVAVVFLMVLIGMSETGLGITLGKFLRPLAAVR